MALKVYLVEVDSLTARKVDLFLQITPQIRKEVPSQRIQLGVVLGDAIDQKLKQLYTELMQNKVQEKPLSLNQQAAMANRIWMLTHGPAQGNSEGIKP